LLNTKNNTEPSETLPVIIAKRVSVLPSESDWQRADAAGIERDIKSGALAADLRTTVRVLWSSAYFFIRYDSPYRQLTVFEPAIFEGKRIGLWNRDVVEVFISTDTHVPNRYAEFQTAPTGERLDLRLDLPHRDFLWDSGFTSRVSIDTQCRIWRTDIQIPAETFSAAMSAGQSWRINFYRHDCGENRFLGWSPTFSETAHVPERFGTLHFEG
jgi:hypothetical protein